MTVRELIQELSRLDGEIQVFVWDPYEDTTDDRVGCHLWNTTDGKAVMIDNSGILEGEK